MNALPLAHEVDFEASPYNKLPTDKTTYLYDVAPYSTTKTYTGEEFTPITTLSIKNKITNEIKDALVEGEDFTVSYRNNTNTGTATAEITYRGDYADYAGDIKTMSFYIEPRNLSDVSITLSEPDYTGGTTEAKATVTYNGNTLTRGIDYDATYTVTELPNPDGSANGKGIATFTGKGNYTGTVTKEFVVKPYNPHNGVAPVKLRNLVISCENNQSFAFNGEEQKITPVLTYEVSDDYIYTLIEGTDYTLTYTENCTDAGNKQLTVRGVQQGTGGFEGSKDFDFTITPANMSTVNISDIEDVNFNHNAFTPKPVITFNGTTLEEGTDYELNYENNTNAGQATVSITGKGNYTDIATKQFNINKLNLNSAIVSEIPNKVYNKGNITPEPTITIGDVTLVKDEDYTLEYSDNVQAGTANITIKGINSVENEINTSFTIEPKPGNSFFITILDLENWQ